MNHIPLAGPSPLPPAPLRGLCVTGGLACAGRSRCAPQLPR